MGGLYPKRGLTPSESEVALVATFMKSPSANVRRSVVDVLRHAKTYPDIVLPAIAAGLQDTDITVQMRAAVAAYNLGFGARVEQELLAVLDSSTWKIRWYAAAALASTHHRDRAAEVFAASFPAKRNSSRHVDFNLYAYMWEQLAAAFIPPTGAITARLETLRR